jgi:hypothetical protein
MEDHEDILNLLGIAVRRLTLQGKITWEKAEEIAVFVKHQLNNNMHEEQDVVKEVARQFPPLREYFSVE